MRTVERVQWAYSALVPPWGAMMELTGNPYTWCGEVFPFTVPIDRWLLITSASMASKFGASGRASYLVIDNCFTLPDVSPVMQFGAAPFIVPPNTTLRARFFNNETVTPDYGAGGEAQWMNMTMSGLLVDHQAGMTYRTCVDGVQL